MRVSVVIATLGRPEPLTAALASVLTSTVAPSEVLVVDGDETGSAATVVAEAAALAPYPVLHVPAPRGLTKQRNVGLDAARGEVVLFLDDDARVRPDVLARVVEEYSDPTVVGVTGRVVEPGGNRVIGKSSPLRALLPGGGEEGTFTRYGYPRRLVHEDRTLDVAFMQGCFLSVRTELGRRLRFDEALPGYGLAEDEDFSCRLSRQGRLRHLGDAVVDHDNGGFDGRDRRVFGQQVVRHRRYLFRKNFPQTPLARLQFGLLILLLMAHRLGNRDLAGLRGLVEGVLERDGLRPAPAAGAAVRPSGTLPTERSA